MSANTAGTSASGLLHGHATICCALPPLQSSTDVVMHSVLHPTRHSRRLHRLAPCTGRNWVCSLPGSRHTLGPSSQATSPPPPPPDPAAPKGMCSLSVTPAICSASHAQLAAIHLTAVTQPGARLAPRLDSPAQPQTSSASNAQLELQLSTPPPAQATLLTSQHQLRTISLHPAPSSVVHDQLKAPTQA